MQSRTLTGNMNVDSIIEYYKSKSLQFSKYSNALLNGFVNDIQSGGTIMIPTIGFMSINFEGFKQDMINVYNGHMGLYDEVTSIPDSVKVLQGALFDGLCYGYDFSNGQVMLYTMKVDLFGGELDSKDYDKVMKANKIGNVYGFKLSYEYLNSDNKEVSFKVGDHRKTLDGVEEPYETENGYGGVALVPFAACTCLLDILQNFMSKQFVIKTVQEVSNGSKIRCVTENEKILAKYCDDPSAVVGLKSLYYPLDAFFYAPSIGSPSTTAMMTLINLFLLSEIRRISNDKQLSEYGVQKPKSPIKDELKTQIIINAVLDAAEEEGNTAYEDLISKFPKPEVLGDVERSKVSASVIRRYLNSIKSGDITNCLKAIPGSKKDFDNKSKLFTEGKAGTPISVDEIESKAKEAVCKVTIKKKDGTFSSMMFTNNKELLAQYYGDDYYARMESFGVRARGLAYKLFGSGDQEAPKDLKAYLESKSDAFKECGFDEVDMDELVATIDSYNGSDMNDTVYNALYDVCDVKHQNPRNTADNVIMVRALGARFSKVTGKTTEYYKNIDLNKVQKAFVL